MRAGVLLPCCLGAYLSTVMGQDHARAQGLLESWGLSRRSAEAPADAQAIELEFALDSATVKGRYSPASNAFTVFWLNSYRPTLFLTYTSSPAPLTPGANPPPRLGYEAYCDSLARIVEVARSRNQNAAATLSGLRRAARFQLSYSLFPPSMYTDRLREKAIQAIQERLPASDQVKNLQVDNPVRVAKVDLRSSWGRSAVSPLEGRDDLLRALVVDVNTKLALVDRDGSAPLDLRADELACDLLRQAVTVEAQADLREPDLERRTERVSAREVRSILQAFQQEGAAGPLGPGTDPSEAGRLRSALLAEALRDARQVRLREFGLDNFALLYRLVFEPDSVTGFPRSVERLGREAAIARALDRVERTPRISRAADMPFAIEISSRDGG